MRRRYDYHGFTAFRLRTMEHPTYVVTDPDGVESFDHIICTGVDNDEMEQSVRNHLSEFRCFVENINGVYRYIIPRARINLLDDACASDFVAWVLAHYTHIGRPYRVGNIVLFPVYDFQDEHFDGAGTLSDPTYDRVDQYFADRIYTEYVEASNPPDIYPDPSRPGAGYCIRCDDGPTALNDAHACFGCVTADFNSGMTEDDPEPLPYRTGGVTDRERWGEP